MATRGGETGEGIKLKKDGTVPKKNRRKIPTPPDRGIETSPVGQVRIGNGSARDLIRFLLGNTDLKVIKGKKAISQEEKRVLRDRALLTSRRSANEISAMAGDLARSRIMNLSPTDFETTRANMREERNMGLTGESMGVGVQDEVIFPDNIPPIDTVQGGSPVNPMLERGRIEAGRSAGPTVPNRTVSRRPPVEMPFGENPNRAPIDPENYRNAGIDMPPPPEPLKYPQFERPQMRGAMPEATLNVARARDERQYGMLGGVDEERNKAYTASQQFAPIVDEDLESLGQGGGPFAYGGKVKTKKKRKKKVKKTYGKSYNY